MKRGKLRATGIRPLWRGLEAGVSAGGCGQAQNTKREGVLVSPPPGFQSPSSAPFRKNLTGSLLLKQKYSSESITKQGYTEKWAWS